MTRGDDGPVSRPGRGRHDDPPPRLEEYRAGRASIDLASGDFRLSHIDGGVRLLAIAPTPADSRAIKGEGSLTSWTRSGWRTFLREAEKFKRSDLLRELEELRDDVIRERISRESPVFDDDSSERPMAVHSLLLHFSRSEGYLRVRGTATHEHREGLRSLGLRWNPSIYEWEAGFSEDLLSSVARFVKRRSGAYDPERIGYERCSCGRWYPESACCPCRSRK